MSDAVEAWGKFADAHRCLHRGMDERLQAEHDLSPSAAAILVHLEDADGHCLRLTHIAALCGLSLGRVSRLIDHLEDRGLIERQQCPTDARATNAHVSDRGRDLAAKARATRDAYLREALTLRLSADEIEEMARCCARLSDRATDGATLSRRGDAER